MAKRGRTSLAELMIPENPTAIQRPDAPYDLDDDESGEWRAIVNSMPADHFTRASFPMLAQLCRHIVASRRVAQLIQQAIKPTGRNKEFNKAEYAALLDIQRAESLAIQRLSRSMRLTQQSSVRAETLTRKLRNQPVLAKAPWDREDDDA